MIAKSETSTSGMKLLMESGSTIGEILAQKDAERDRLRAQRDELAAALELAEINLRAALEWAPTRATRYAMEACCDEAKAALAKVSG